ncbi:MAG: hypothetical protein H6599_11950 [Flavobacteriales bacterium]|nr:hypothetical protein [Flavobacteriales bacterium]
MKLKIVVCIVFTLVLTCKAFSQIPRNSVYFELMGPAVTMSLNYERYFIAGEKSHFGANFGLGLIGESNSANRPFIPLTLTYNLGANKSFFESGIGYTYSTTQQVGAAHFVLGYKRMVKTD